MVMISWLKKHFIPHENNDYRPHILRDSNTHIFIFIIILLEIVTFLGPTLTHLNMTGGMAAVLPAVLDDLTNGERQSQKLNILTVNPILNKAAEMKANDMAVKGYFAHTSPEGKTPWFWLQTVGYDYQYAGENLAVNFSDSKDVTDAWMNSPTHKANIIKENYTEIGTGIATGMYEGKEAIFVAQVYANPNPNLIPKIVTQVEIKKPEVKIKEKTLNTVNVKEPANILGAEINVLDVNTQVALKNEIKKTEVKDITSSKKPTFWQRLFASPRSVTNIVLDVIFGIIMLSLLLYFFIKIKNFHFDLVTNGLAVLAIIGAMFVVNYNLSHRNMIITKSIDYSVENR